MNSSGNPAIDSIVILIFTVHEQLSSGWLVPARTSQRRREYLGQEKMFSLPLYLISHDW